MLTQLLMLGAPALWLALTVVVLAACRAAGRADAVAGDRLGSSRLDDGPRA